MEDSETAGWAKTGNSWRPKRWRPKLCWTKNQLYFLWLWHRKIFSKPAKFRPLILMLRCIKFRSLLISTLRYISYFYLKSFKIIYRNDIDTMSLIVQNIIFTCHVMAVPWARSILIHISTHNSKWCNTDLLIIIVSPDNQYYQIIFYMNNYV